MHEGVRSKQNEQAMSRDPDHGRSPRSRLAEQVFTGVNVVVFIVLLACVVGAAVLWDRWH